MSFKIKHLNESGFTLIEVLIAITIFSVGLLALAKLQMSASLGNMQAARVTSATMAAASRMESLLSLDYSNIPVSGNLTEAGYQITYSVTQPNTGIKHIVLHVDRSGLFNLTDTYETFVVDLQ